MYWTRPSHGAVNVLSSISALDASHRCTPRFGGGLGIPNLGLRRGDRRLRGRHLRAGRAERSGSAVDGRTGIIRLLLGSDTPPGEFGNARRPAADGFQLGLALGDQRLGGKLLALSLGELAVRGRNGGLSLAELGLRLFALGLERTRVHQRDDLAGSHKVTLVNQDFPQPAWCLRRDVDLHRLDAPVTTEKAFMPRSGVELMRCDYQHRECKKGPYQPWQPASEPVLSHVPASSRTSTTRLPDDSQRPCRTRSFEGCKAQSSRTVEVVRTGGAGLCFVTPAWCRQPTHASTLKMVPPPGLSAENVAYTRID
jgi:hypothetical protein